MKAAESSAIGDQQLAKTGLAKTWAKARILKGSLTHLPTIGTSGQDAGSNPSVTLFNQCIHLFDVGSRWCYGQELTDRGG